MLLTYYIVRLDLGMTQEQLILYSLTYVYYISLFISNEAILVLIIY